MPRPCRFCRGVRHLIDRFRLPGPPKTAARRTTLSTPSSLNVKVTHASFSDRLVHHLYRGQHQRSDD